MTDITELNYEPTGNATSHSQQTRDIDPMLDQCCATVYDAGPTLVQHWVMSRVRWDYNLRHTDDFQLLAHGRNIHIDK